MPDKHLVLVGGGHAQIHVFEGFAADPPPGLRVTVVVDRPTAMYSGMVPGYVAGMYQAEELALDVPSWVERMGAELRIDAAVGLDPAEYARTRSAPRVLNSDSNRIDRAEFPVQRTRMDGFMKGRFGRG